MIIVISSYSKSKDDSLLISSDSKVVDPSYYIEDENMIYRLLHIRKQIFNDPRADVGSKSTYAFDLYVRRGKAYKNLLSTSYENIKKLIMEGHSLEWFFLSGGYGIIHALEEARKYQATFNYNIARYNNIPYTKRMKKCLV